MASIIGYTGKQYSDPNPHTDLKVNIMNHTLVEVKKEKGGVVQFEVDATNEHTLRADLRKHDAELSFVQAQKFLKEGHGVHFDLDEKTRRFSLGYLISKVN